MSDSLRTESLSNATSIVITPPSDTSKSFYGQTDQEATPRDGSLMSSVERWLREEKLSGITGASLLSSSLVLLVFLYVSFFAYKRKHIDNFWFEGKHYVMVSLGEVGEIKQSGKKIYAPVYEESLK